MTGLRARSKKRRRGEVLNAAERLFREHGYERTTIEDIAGASEVSIGTIYAYFGSKGGILGALMRPVIEEMRFKGQAVIANPPKRAVDAIAALYEAYRFSNDWKHVNVLKAFDSRNRSGDPELEKISDAFEEFITNQVGEMLRKKRAEGLLKESVDIDDAVFFIYILLISHFEAHLNSGGARTYEEILVAMHRRLRVLFIGWEG
jgi:AcrR family transcriptional regulator